MAIGPQTAEARAKISVRYKEMFGKDLKSVMKKECSGDLGAALQFLAVSPEMAECDMIHEACSGIGTNEKILYPIICGRTNEEINILKKAYFKEYTKDLSVLIAKETAGDFEKILFNCLQGSQETYDPKYHTEAKAKEDAETIYKAGQGRTGTKENEIFKILCASPPEHLKVINLDYAEKYGYTLFKALEKELRGDSEEASLFLLGMKLKPYETVATLIKDACAGVGTNELLLTTTLIRYQGIMDKVNEAHLELYSKVREYFRLLRASSCTRTVV